MSAGLNWDDLRFFLAVAEAGSLSAASSLLKVNTTTVLRRVASLEEALGARLFDRSRSGYRLTPRGERLLTQLAPVDQRLSALERDFVADDSEADGVVRVAAGDVFASAVLGPQLPTFRDAHPELRLEIIADPSLTGPAPSAGAPAGSMKDVDVAVRFARPTQGNVIVRKIGDMAYGLYASRAYTAVRGAPKEPGRLAGHRVIGFGLSESPLGPVWWMSRAEQGASVVVRSNAVSVRAEAARQGLGLTALPCIAGDADPLLMRIGAADEVGALELWLVTHNDTAHVGRVRDAMDFVVSCAKAAKLSLLGSGDDGEGDAASRDSAGQRREPQTSVEA
ncbi:LysR family transcriptional regulator [Pyruvatibacter sp.]|uniref:LysR family transcriptional regulator n=1 Tax=Pyruvatibacter sp. TaxID=1981328 RepID=UPI0032EDE717